MAPHPDSNRLICHKRQTLADWLSAGVLFDGRSRSGDLTIARRVVEAAARLIQGQGGADEA